MTDQPRYVIKLGGNGFFEGFDIFGADRVAFDVAISQTNRTNRTADTRFDGALAHYRDLRAPATDVNHTAVPYIQGIDCTQIPIVGFFGGRQHAKAQPRFGLDTVEELFAIRGLAYRTRGNRYYRVYPTATAHLMEESHRLDGAVHGDILELPVWTNTMGKPHCLAHFVNEFVCLLWNIPNHNHTGGVRAQINDCDALLHNYPVYHSVCIVRYRFGFEAIQCGLLAKCNLALVLPTALTIRQPACYSYHL